MKRATFYLLWSSTASYLIDNQTQWICNLVHAQWREKRKGILVACLDQQQAIQLDQALWTWAPHTFLPHNLVGQGPTHGAPVELIWPPQCPDTSYDLLITLLPQCINYASSFSEVIDFVPLAESCKALARARYKTYRNLGFTLHTKQLPKTCFDSVKNTTRDRSYNSLL
ncbi:DNA polymerase III subunit chi [Candidatus Erwinia haradaeae]|uniref:DNA polymerase III subunit chi n=1 Tax=Candidatus Erwinia haradaeae TaxID=1922217 RepID=A0A451DDM4_9GAMM|nr:DNA polymerase III subunit chi [Candidatus Erwinia haradaeae]VFP84527.1 DNA polymerase III subunit chi [Candidatus Erwinia haradaeae]